MSKLATIEILFSMKSQRPIDHNVLVTKYLRNPGVGFISRVSDSYFRKELVESFQRVIKGQDSTCVRDWAMSAEKCRK